MERKGWTEDMQWCGQTERGFASEGRDYGVRCAADRSRDLRTEIERTGETDTKDGGGGACSRQMG